MLCCASRRPIYEGHTNAERMHGCSCRLQRVHHMTILFVYITMHTRRLDIGSNAVLANQCCWATLQSSMLLTPHCTSPAEVQCIPCVPVPSLLLVPFADHTCAANPCKPKSVAAVALPGFNINQNTITGQSIDGLGSSAEPDPCPKGTYFEGGLVPTDGASTCQPCPFGTTTLGNGTISVANCGECCIRVRRLNLAYASCATQFGYRSVKSLHDMVTAEALLRAVQRTTFAMTGLFMWPPFWCTCQQALEVLAKICCRFCTCVHSPICCCCWFYPVTDFP
jgi:hypothetical protein